MSSEFLIAVPHELPKQDNLVNKGREGRMFEEDYTNNHLQQKLSLSVPEFPCIRNFPFNKNMKFYDMPMPNHTATKKHALDEELDTRLPKLIKLHPEFSNYRSETAVDMVNAVRSQVIKNDVILSEILENPPNNNNNNERTNALVEETSLQQLNHEALDTSNSDHISVEAIDSHCCATIENLSCSDRKTSDQEQGFLKIETESAVLKIQRRNDSSASLVSSQDCVTETENVLLNTEKRVFFAHEFDGAETGGDEYHSIHDSFSLSEFLICPTSFEQKESCDTLLPSVQKEEAGGSSVIATIGASANMERKDVHVMFQHENEISEHAHTSFAPDNESVGEDVCDNTSHTLYETQNLPHNAEVGTNSNLLHNNIPGSEMITGQTVVKEEFSIKQEVEEDPTMHTILVPSVDLLHNRELDLDDTVFQNWFMSIANQETVTESVSASICGHHESSISGNTEDLCSRTTYKENLASALAKSAAAKEYSVEPHTRQGNESVAREWTLTDLTGESGCIQVADRYDGIAQSCKEEIDTGRFLQNLFPSVPDASPTEKTEASFEKGKNTCEDQLLTDLSVATLSTSAVAQIPTTNLQSLENKSDSPATTESDVENSARPESVMNHKHHKKVLIRKFSSGLLEDEKCEKKSSEATRIETETAVKDSALPSTSTAVTNEDKCVKDCIVISDSDDDSIIEFDVVKTCPKKRFTKSTHSGSLGKNSQSSSRKCTRSSANEESLGLQTRISTIKNSAVLDCIVVSDSDDESPKPPLSSQNRASNSSDEGANISGPESRVSVIDGNHRNKTESHGVIDLSGGRSPFAISQNNGAVPSTGGSSISVIATASGDSQCSLTDRLGALNNGVDTSNSNTFAQILAAAITYNPAQSNVGRELNGSDVIDLSRRNTSPLISSWQNKTNSAVDVLDLSGSDKKQQERHSVIISVGAATENNSATKDITEDKDSSPAWSCPICFESLLSGRQSVSSTPCGHVFCTKCIEEAVNQFKKCPTCCRKVALKRVHKIFL